MGFHLLENSHKLCGGFHQAMKAWITCFISSRKLSFSVLIKRKTVIQCVSVYFKFFHETVNSHNLETESTILLTSFSCYIVS